MDELSTVACCLKDAPNVRVGLQAKQQQLLEKEISPIRQERGCSSESSSSVLYCARRGVSAGTGIHQIYKDHSISIQFQNFSSPTSTNTWLKPSPMGTVKHSSTPPHCPPFDKYTLSIVMIAYEIVSKSWTD
jgi:hypothetical protein